MPDYGFIAQPQVPNAMQTIGQVVNTAQGIQGLQQQRQQIGLTGIQLQRAQQANAERVATQNYVASGAPVNPDGTINMQKMAQDLPKIAPLTAADTLQKWSTLSKAQTAAEQAKLDFSSSERQILGNLMGVYGRAGTDDPAPVEQGLDALKTQYGPNSPMAKYIDAAKVGLSAIPAGKGVLNKTLITQSQALLSPSQQQAQLSPTAGVQNVGGGAATVINTPAVGGNAPSVVPTGQGFQYSTSPNTPIFNPQTNTPGYVGQPFDPSKVGVGYGPAQQPAQEPQPSTQTQPAAPLQAGPALGVKEAAGGEGQTVATDWNNTFASAKGAAQDIGVLQNLKALAPQAILGVGQNYRSYVAGVRGLFDQSEKTQNLLQGIIGAKNAQEAKTATDLFMKNANMPSLAGGTDAMRTLLESTNPNVHMTPTAVTEAADQVIAQRKLALIRQQYLQPEVGNPQAYTKAAAQFSDMADPRALQYPDMNVQQKSAMWHTMTPSERKAFGEKLQFFQAHGWLK